VNEGQQPARQAAARRALVTLLILATSAACVAPVAGPDPRRIVAREHEPLALASAAAKRRAVATTPAAVTATEVTDNIDVAALRVRFDRAAAWNGVLDTEDFTQPVQPAQSAQLSGPTGARDETALLRAIAEGAPALAAAERRFEATLESYDQIDLLGDIVQRLRAFTRTASPIRSGPAMAAGDRVRSTGLAPWPSLEALRGELALRSTEMAFEAWRATAHDLAVRGLTFDARLEFVDAERRVQEGQQALLDELLPVARAGLATGRGRQANLLALEAQRERVLGRIDELGSAREGLAASLAALVGDDPLNMTSRAAKPTLGSRAPGSREVGAPRALAPHALAPPETAPADLQPALTLAGARNARAAVALRLAEVMALGPTDLGASRFERGLKGETSVARPGSGPGASLPEPTSTAVDFGAREALLRELRLSLEATERDVAAVRLELEGRRARAESAWREAATRWRVNADEVLPRERASYDSLRGSWSGGAVGFLDVYQAASRVLDVELALARAALDLGLARVDWLAATGQRPAELYTRPPGSEGARGDK